MNQNIKRVDKKWNMVTGGHDLWIWSTKGYLMMVVPIDFTYYAQEWNMRHKMHIVDTVTAGDEVFDIWENAGCTLRNATPRKEVEA